MNSKLVYDKGNPIIVYTCKSCKYTTFGEAFITNNKISKTTNNGSSSTIKLTKLF